VLLITLLRETSNSSYKYIYSVVVFVNANLFGKPLIYTQHNITPENVARESINTNNFVIATYLTFFNRKVRMDAL